MDRKPIDRQQADAIAEAMLEQPRARQAQQAQRARRARPLPRWRRLGVAVLLGFFGGKAVAGLTGIDEFLPAVAGMTLAGVMVLATGAYRQRRTREA